MTRTPPGRLPFALLALPLLGIDACPGPSYEVVAHRGFSSIAPENTIAAFDAAEAVGAEHFELDIHRTIDGEIVCLHDDTLDRTTDCTGPVAGWTYAEIAGCDAGSWFDAAFAGEPIPRLAEVLDRYADGTIGLYVEIKASGLEADLVELIRARDAFDRVTVISFSAASLDAVLAALEPGEPLPTSLLSSSSSVEVLDQAVAHGFDGVGLKASTVTRAIVDAAHARGLAVNVWTVNSSSGMKAAGRQQVDVLTTDRPDVALALRPADD